LNNILRPPIIILAFGGRYTAVGSEICKALHWTISRT